MAATEHYAGGVWRPAVRPRVRSVYKSGGVVVLRCACCSTERSDLEVLLRPTATRGARIRRFQENAEKKPPSTQRGRSGVQCTFKHAKRKQVYEVKMKSREEAVPVHDPERHLQKMRKREKNKSSQKTRG